MPQRRRSGLKKYLNLKGFGVAALVVVAVVAIGVLISTFLTNENVVQEKLPTKMAMEEIPEPAVSGMTGIQEPVSEMTEIEEPATASSEISGEWLGLCKRDSIHSVEDFRRTVANDAVLAKHFSGFNWATARLGRQAKEIRVFVSYRRGDVIRRTSKPVRLPKGDGYITDGTHIVRTYCCNDYAIPPLGSPSAGGNPPEESPPPPEDPAEQLPMDPAPADPPEEAPPTSAKQVPNYFPSPFPPSYPSPNIYSGKLPDTPPSTDPVPEPATMLLMGTGLAGLIIARKKKRV